MKGRRQRALPNGPRSRRRGVRASAPVVVLLIGWLLASCVVEPPLAIELAGCVVVDARGCHLAERRPVQVWTGRQVAVLVDGLPVGPAQEADGGWRVEVQPPSLGGQLRVGHLTMRLVAPPPADPGDEAVRLAQAGAPVAAQRVLDGWADAPAARLASLRGRLAMQRGDPDGAVAYWEEAATAWRFERGPRWALDDELARIWAQRAHHRLAGQALLDRLDGLSVDPLDGEARVRVLWHRALVLRDSGDLRGGLDGLEVVIRQAGRLGMARMERDGWQARAALLAGLGRFDEAAAALARASVLPEGTDCERAGLRINEGWVAWLAWQAGRGPLRAEPFDEAAALYAGTCPRAPSLANAQVNRALVAWAGGRLEEALVYLDASRAAAAHPSAEVRAWQDELEARLLLASGQSEQAGVAFAAAEQRAEAAGQYEHAWRAASGSAALTGAVEDWRRAEALLDRLAALVPLGEGREVFTGDRAASAMGLVDALLRAGRTAEALDAARRARLRALGALAASWRTRAPTEAMLAWRRLRAEAAAQAALDWTLPGPDAAARQVDRARALEVARQAAVADLDGPATRELPPLRDLTLAFVPLADGLAVFAASSGWVRAVRLQPVPDGLGVDELSRRLLGSFDAEIGAAARLRLLVGGPLRDLDVHALPWRGRPLGAALPVAWALDLPLPPPSAGGAAVVVGDPGSDLPHARAEALEAARRLGVTALLGAEATWGEVMARLPRAEVAHLAAHGEGRGWSSGLQLAGGGRLEVADVLALPSAPGRVVLSACGLGADAGSTWDGLGLAHAFVLAGAGQVVAARRPVDDLLAASLGPRLLDEGDAARALQILMASGIGGDVAAWRVLEP